MRDDLWTCEFVGAILLLLVSTMGVILCLIGINKLPTCNYGDAKCHFFVEVCGNGVANSICWHVPKMAAIEGRGDRAQSEQVTIPMIAAVFGIIPAICFAISTTIRNQRTLLALLESGKAFFAANSVLLVMSVIRLDRLTFDCRYWNNVRHGNTHACQQGYGLYIGGAITVFVCQLALLASNVAFAESERKRFADDRLWFDINSELGGASGVSSSSS